MEIIKKHHIKQLMIIAVIDSIASLFYLNFPIEGFRITFSVVFFPWLLDMYDDLNPVLALGFAAVVEIFFRSVGIFFQTGDFIYAFFSSYQEILFYLIYGLIFYYLYSKHNGHTSIIGNFIIFFLCDFAGNFGEFIMRIFTLPETVTLKTLKFIIYAALIRAGIALLTITFMKYFELLIVKEEHEERYKKLVSLATDLKAETYFMNMNVDYLEKVMNNAYVLYGKISKMKEMDDLKKLSLNIAKDVHEIKKDYLRVIRGIEEIMNNKIKYSNMEIKDIFEILKQNTDRFLNFSNEEIDITFDIKENFYIKEHYSFMSVFRNLINNAIEAINEKGEKGEIIVRHRTDGDMHIFTISDNGIGIKEKNLEYIFQARFSTKFDKSTGNISRGIGLTLVKAVVENKFGGELEVESQYNQGTTFKIIIPKKRLGG